MQQSEYKSTDEYIALQPSQVQAALEIVRSAIRAALPDVEESIAYRMPTYKIRGKIIICMAGWKRHYSLYLATNKIVATFKDELAQYEIEKGSIRFSYALPVPVELIKRIATIRAQEIATTAEDSPPVRCWQSDTGDRVKQGEMASKMQDALATNQVPLVRSLP